MIIRMSDARGSSEYSGGVGMSENMFELTIAGNELWRIGLVFVIQRNGFS